MFTGQNCTLCFVIFQYHILIMPLIFPICKRQAFRHMEEEVIIKFLIPVMSKLVASTFHAITEKILRMTLNKNDKQPYRQKYEYIKQQCQQ